MNKKQNILIIAIFMFMVISLSFTTSQTFAYWAEPIQAPEIVDSTGIIATGEWEQIFPYDSNFNEYVAGDLVSYNGDIYEARNGWANILTPGSGWFWTIGWTRL